MLSTKLSFSAHFKKSTLPNVNFLSKLKEDNGKCSIS